MPTRATFIAVAAAVAAATPSSAAAARAFDRTAFEARLRRPFRHRQVFASPRVADGAVLGFMVNSLNAYETGFGEGPGTLHAAAVFYSLGAALALDDTAWRTLRVAEAVRKAGDRVSSGDAENGNPFVHAPRGWSFADLRRRHASFFVCDNALHDLARRTGTTPDRITARLLPGMMVVPAGVAALNAAQEEHFTLFVASA